MPTMCHRVLTTIQKAVIKQVELVTRVLEDHLKQQHQTSARFRNV
jgi:hypothetical protein